MHIRKVLAVYYSATGNTKKVICAAVKGAADRLGLPWEEYSFSTPAERSTFYDFGPGDLVLVGSPTYAGKLPNKLLPDFQTRLRGNGAFAAAMVTYGNRSYDNALAELSATLEQNGFHTAAGAAFVGQHAFALRLAENRPGPMDLEEAENFGRQTAEKLLAADAVPSPVQVPGDAAAPYYIPKGVDGQPAKFLKAKPLTRDELCDRCGICARVCPMGSIDPMDVCAVPGICIKCQACVRRCPTGAKYFDDPAFLSHREMLEQTYTEARRNETYF